MISNMVTERTVTALTEMGDTVGEQVFLRGKGRGSLCEIHFRTCGI